MSRPDRAEEGFAGWDWVAALALAGLARAVSALLIVGASGAQQGFVGFTPADPGYWGMATLWDGTWYQLIALDGYPPVAFDAAGHVEQNPWAFYPLFPWLCRPFLALGLPFAVVGPMLSLLFGLAAAVVNHLLLRDRVGIPASLATVAVAAFFVSAPATQIAYSDALSLLLLACLLLALTRERWFTAAALVVAFGLSRPIAAPAVVVVGVALWLRHRGRRPWERREVRGALTLGAASVLAVGLWPGVMALATGRADAYVRTQAAWWPDNTLVSFEPWRMVVHWVRGDDVTPLRWVVALLFVSAALAATPLARRLGPLLRAWVVAYALYLTVVARVELTSTVRFLLPLWPVAAILLGAGFASRRRRLTVPLGVVGVLALVGVAAGLVGQTWWVGDILVFAPGEPPP